MMRATRTILVLSLLCGCAGRINTGLLQARIREQATQLTDSQREIEKTRSELKQSRQEVAQLKAGLANVGEVEDAPPPPDVQITKIQIFPLSSGGLNKDELPGDDAVVVQFAPLDSGNAPLKQPGDVEITVIDPRMPETDRVIGSWNFSVAECRDRWTRGIANTGFQFTLPLEQSPRHHEVVVNLKFKTLDNRRLETNQVVKVVAGSGKTIAGRQRRKPIKAVEETDDAPPPVVASRSDSADSDWDTDEPQKPSTPRGAVRHSANWTDATIPVLR